MSGNILNTPRTFFSVALTRALSPFSPNIMTDVSPFGSNEKMGKRYIRQLAVLGRPLEILLHYFLQLLNY